MNRFITLPLNQLVGPSTLRASAILRSGPKCRACQAPLLRRRSFSSSKRTGQDLDSSPSTSQSIGPHRLKWSKPPTKVLVVAKPNDVKTLEATEEIVKYFRAEHEQIQIFIEEPVGSTLSSGDHTMISNSTNEREGVMKSIDLVICLGGDGTVLHTSSLFSKGPVPPIVGFSLGTLGFLLPFHINDLRTVLNDVLTSNAYSLNRMRLECSILNDRGLPIERFKHLSVQAMNEVHLHRGRHPHMTVINTFVDGQKLTEAVADGLIVSTPTGSTAYSLSAGGPIVHPLVQSLILTPICPRSLSFRTVILPSQVSISLQISPNSRSPAELSLDGREVQLLNPNEVLQVKLSPYSIPCVIPCDVEQGEGKVLNCDQGWVRDINAMLSFNRTFLKRGLTEDT